MSGAGKVVAPAPLTRRSAPLTVADLAGEGRFSGYASVFGRPDLGRDVIERGAFLASLARRGPDAVRMLYQHDPAEVIGRWTVIREDDHGLYVEGQLTPGSARAAEVHAHLLNRAIDGLSIGFRALRTSRDGRGGWRRILEADLWEISIVTFPMLPEARVGAVKRAVPVRPPPVPDRPPGRIRTPFRIPPPGGLTA